MELLSAVTAEECGIEPCALIAGQKELTVERNRAVLRVERGIDIAGTGDEAVQLERKKGSGTLGPALFAGPAHIYEHVPKLRAAAVQVGSTLLRQPNSGLFEGHRLVSPQFLAIVEAYRQFDPDGKWVLRKFLIGHARA